MRNIIAQSQIKPNISQLGKFRKLKIPVLLEGTFDEIFDQLPCWQSCLGYQLLPEITQRVSMSLTI